MNNKIIIQISIIIILLWGSIWLFNHFNPYAGIILAIATILTTINYIIKKSNEKIN